MVVQEKWYSNRKKWPLDVSEGKWVRYYFLVTFKEADVPAVLLWQLYGKNSWPVKLGN